MRKPKTPMGRVPAVYDGRICGKMENMGFHPGVNHVTGFISVQIPLY